MGTPETATFRLLVSYNGARFNGWQRGNGRTVQSTLEEAVAGALEAATHGTADGSTAVKVDGAGRTDAGVHAEGQVASVVLPPSVDEQLLLELVNRALPHDLALRAVERVDARFHARYRAVGKTYRYRMDDGPVGNPFLHRFSWRVAERLDPEPMKLAAQAFIGTHDFTSFTADRGKRNKERTVRSIRFDRTTVAGEGAFDIVVFGDGFLWKQIRMMVAALVDVGRGAADVDSVRRILEARDRALAPPPAPGYGLTLLSVEYEADS